jgi:hypothetical protein
MGNIGDSITPSVPIVGSAGPQYATDINAILTEIVARLSAKVPLASINFNSNLDLSGSDLLNIGNIVFSNQLSTPSGSPFNRFAVFGGNLYYVNAAGAVQITSGSTLNAAALAGITGDYGGANPAQLNYVAIDTRYNHYANFSTGTWAYDRALGFDVAGGATSTAFARILWAGGSNITLTLPATLPAANQLLSVDNTGAITAGTSAALANNNNITLSGTGTYKHGTKTVQKLVNGGDVIVLAGSLTNQFSTRGISYSSAGDFLVRLPSLHNHQRLVDLIIGFSLAADRTGLTAQIVKWGSGDPATNALTNVGSALSNTGTAKMQVTGVNAQVSAGEEFWLRLTSTTNGGIILTETLNYDVP